ncbi:MAG: ATPase, T2SS/T4P/T4SS family [Pseudomonadota bacterium]|nr:ATPase, T2SS/T4P/T4SS family [Pseudomonadota bacterium]
MSLISPVAPEKIDFIHYLHQCGYINDVIVNQLRGKAYNATQVSKLTSIDESILGMYHDQWLEVNQTDLDLSIQDDCLILIDRLLCCQYVILPFLIQGNQLLVACKNPYNMKMRKEVAKQLQKKYKPVYMLAKSDIILPLLHVYYRDVKEVIIKAKSVADGKSFMAGAQKVFDELIDAILLDGFAHHATDIHLVSSGGALSYRLRTHHQFFPVVDLPAGISDGLRNRLLIRGGCAFNRLQHVQDAAITVANGNEKIPIRVSHIPTGDGYSIVLRIIREEFLIIEEANFNDLQWQNLEFQLQFNKGLMLVCGPVGSGKTTIYYGIMKRLLGDRLKIISIEDPIESQIPHAFQMDLSHTQLTFQDTMKIILRQDPDVLMIGETRSEDAARCLAEAKISGHMVVSTIHALSPWDCLLKLAKLGFEQNQLLNQTITIVTVRLIPRLCQSCVVDHHLTEQEQDVLKDQKSIKQVKQWRRSIGCPKCHFSGIETITPFYDILSLTPQDLAMARDSWENLRSVPILQAPIDRLSAHLMHLASQGLVDIKTYFSLVSV